MKIKGILALLLLALFLSSAGRASGEDLYAAHHGHSLFQFTNEPIDCLIPGLPAAYDFEMLPDSSGAGLEGGVLRSMLCNYTLTTNSSHPAGPDLVSGMAITLEFACPAQTTESWNGKTGPRASEILRTPNSVVTRETGEFTSFSGDRTVQERMFLLLDTHTIATIVILTDPNPINSGESVFSANSAPPIAAGLANTYGSRANDPVCGPPPGATISTPGGNVSTTSIPAGAPPWDVITGVTAVAVAVGAGSVAALAGGLLGSAGGSALGSSAQAGAAAQPVPVAVPVSPPPPAFTPVAAPSTISAPEPSAVGVGPPLPAAEPVAPSVQDAGPIPSTSPLPVELAVAPPAIEPPFIQPLVEVAEAVAAAGGAIAQAGATARSSSSQADQDEGSGDDEEVAKSCPEAQAPLFGLLAINGRQDCPGARPSMGQWYAGIDFTSNDEHGVPARLDFEACVTGEVTYAGGPFNMVEVKQENGNRIQFLHASEIYVSPGQQVGADTKLGKTGGTGPEGPDQYEIHLHVQAIDEQGNMIDLDCAIASKDNRKLRVDGSASPHRERLDREKEPPATSADTGSEPIPDAETVQLPPIEQEPPTPAAVTPGLCGNCGKANSAAARFCSNCGQPLTP